MALIVITAIIIYLVLMAWTWQSLGFMAKTKKVIFMVIGIILMYVITLFVFQMTKGGIIYENPEMQKGIQNILVAIFTGINGIIIMPQIARIWDKIQEDETKKEILGKRIIILIIVFIVCLILESNYMKDTQETILRMYQGLGDVP